MTTLEEFNNTCPFTGMGEFDCDRDDTPDGMSADHIRWHTNKLIDAGMIVVVAQDIATHGQNKIMVTADTWELWSK